MDIQRCVISIAVGNKYYLNLAANLLRSFVLHNADNGVHFLLLTDHIDYFKLFQNDRIHIIPAGVSRAESSFTAKFIMYDKALAVENLFIDCDCLIYGDLDAIFDRLNHQSFTVIGHNSNTGTFFCDIPQVLKQFKLASMPKFVGSLYFFKKDITASEVFRHAKALKNEYDQMGLIRLRGKENEEPLLAIAMAVRGLQPVKDDGSVKADAMFFDTYKCNVSKGRAQLLNKSSPKNPEYCNLKSAKPVIVHYNDRYTELSVYLSEQLRLEYAGRAPGLLELKVYFLYKLPETIITGFKATFRKLYHRLHGPSPISKIKRIE